MINRVSLDLGDVRRPFVTLGDLMVRSDARVPARERVICAAFRLRVHWLGPALQRLCAPNVSAARLLRRGTGGWRHRPVNVRREGLLVRDIRGRRRVLVFAAGAAALLGGTGLLAVPGAAAATPVAHAGAVGAASGWGQAKPVPGLALLNKGGDANVLSVSCPSAGNCAA